MACLYWPMVLLRLCQIDATEIKLKMSQNHKLILLFIMSLLYKLGIVKVLIT